MVAVIRTLVTLMVIGASSASVQCAVAQQPDSARAVSSLGRAARLTVRDVRITTALDKLSETSGVVLAYSPSILEGRTDHVTCECSGRTVAEALDQILAGTRTGYTEMNGRVVVFRPAPPARDIDRDSARARVAANYLEESVMKNSLGYVLAISTALATAPQLKAQEPPITVTGKVATEAGVPLAGVQVYIPEMSLGSATDVNGLYTFVVPSARVRGQSVTLTARRVGHKPQSVQIILTGALVTQDFTLTQTAAQLAAVLVTGAGTVSTEEQLGNRIDRVASSEIVKSNEFNIAEALAAKAPNLQIQSQSGDPGASVSLMIRGIKTLTGDGQPLWVVDGVPIDNSTNTTNTSPGGGVVAPNRAADVNSSDIESVEILKGAAAAAIYGSRAAQGVILITTKSGRSGATKYSFASSVSNDNVNKKFSLQQKYGQGDLGLSGLCTTPNCSAARYSWGPELTPPTYIAALTTSTCNNACAQARFQQLYPNGIQTFDHASDVFVTGHQTVNEVSISGGDDRRTFFLSGGRSQDLGDVIGPNDSYTRNTLRLKATQRMTERLNIGANIAYVDATGSFIQRGNNASGLELASLRTPPDFDNRNFITVDGFQRAYRFPNPTAASQNVSRGFDNPFFIAYKEPATSSLGRVYGNINLDYHPAEWLTLSYLGGGDFGSDERLEAFPLTAAGNAAIGPLGGLTRANFVSDILDQNVLAIGKHTFGRSVETELTVGQNLNSTATRQIFVTGNALIAPEPFTLANTLFYSTNDNQTLVHRESYFAQLRVGLWDQLYLTGAGRNDGSSAFAQNNNRHSYPKASVAWTFSKALGDLGGKLDFGKARFAYGVTGKEPAPYSTLFSYTRGQFVEYGQGAIQTPYLGQAGLVSPALIGQERLKPERTSEYELGLDLGFWNGFSDLSLTQYQARSVDVIFALPTTPSSGHTMQVQNAGEISNRGFEVTSNFHLLRLRNVSWDLGLLWSKNRNNVDRIGSCTSSGFANGTCQQEYVVVSVAGQSAVARPGFPVGSLESVDFARCRYGAKSNVVGAVDINAYCKAQNAPEGALYIDNGTLGQAGFPVIDPTLRIAGSSQPDWQGAIQNSVTLKRLTLSALVDIRKGSQMWDGTLGALYAYGTSKGTEIRGQQFVFGPAVGGVQGFYTQSVTGPGQGTPVTIGQNWFQGNGGSFGPNATQFMEGAGFLKLREVSIAYALDQQWVKSSLGLSTVDVRLSGRNLRTWTKYRGIDPESNLYGASGFIQGFDWFNNPQTSSIVLSVGLTR
jgi:TonB-linked SusC/RagA family outer membrane protein